MKNTCSKEYFNEETTRLFNLKYDEYEYDYYLFKSVNNSMVEPLLRISNIDKYVLICDNNIKGLYIDKIKELIGPEKCIVISFEGGEDNKTLSVVNNMIEEILSYKVTRRACIVGVGGGIVGNMAGMVAALLFRGLKLVHIPTSLMAILDSVISLKQAINSSQGKNLIGCFYKPELVITSIEFLNTLPKEHIISGLCEVIKNAFIILPDSIDKLSNILNSEGIYTEEDFNYFIDMSIESKQKLMLNDYKERKEALVLEYGHTIGHAIELSSKGEVNHGQGVGLGMICAAEISRRLGYLTSDDVNLHIELLSKNGSLLKLPHSIKAEDILNIIRYDNKRGYLKKDKDKQNLVILKEIGEPLMQDDMCLVGVEEELIKDVINEIL